MKVDVIEVGQAVFGRFSWWSNWIDVAVFNNSTQPYLIQMQVSRKNKKKFRSVKISGKEWQLRQVRVEQVGDLTQMKESENG